VEQSVTMQVHEISSRHAELELFSQISGYLANSERPIARFLARLPIPAIELESVRTELFGTPGLAIGPSAIEVAHLVPEYETFLQSVAPTTLREQPVVPALLVHDLVGHLILEQPTTPRGELIACAGVAGFSWEAGADYFINAILMFSLGLPLFDDVVPGRCEIDAILAAECALAWKRAGHYRRQLTTSPRGVTALAYLLLHHWNYLKALPPKDAA
jgi:hypothetical protein